MLRRRQDGGLIVESTKFWTMLYADDVALIVPRENEGNDTKT